MSSRMPEWDALSDNRSLGTVLYNFFKRIRVLSSKQIVVTMTDSEQEAKGGVID
jgi:hypothetical protein